MTERLTLYIGVGDSSNRGPWERLASRTPALVLLDIGPKTFWRAAGLDVEIMATSFMVTKFDVRAPEIDAGCYRFDEGSPFAPIVVVPPATSRPNMPAELPEWTDDSPEGYTAYFAAHGFEVDVYNWKRVLAKVTDLRRTAASDLRVGFHCDSIGYFTTPHQQKARAFEAAYSEVMGDSHD